MDPVGAVLAWWRRAEGPAAPRTSVRPLHWAALLCLGVSLLGAELALEKPRVEEDAFIGFRFARNLATGEGLRYNVGEPPAEGFSNTLWLLLLAAGYSWRPDMVHVSMALGVVLGMLQLALVAWMACRWGGAAWVPVVLLATNVSFGRSLTSGLETPLVSFLVLAAACFWSEEAADGRSLTMVLTSVCCVLVALARADGWFLFLGISLFRLLSAAGKPASRMGVQWYAPFAVSAAVYLLVRWLYYGSFTPYIYYGRLLTQRGSLEARLVPGLTYVARTLFWNAALALGFIGLRLAPPGPLRARGGAVLVTHLVLLILIGGDADYMPYHRFLMPVAGLLALFAQNLVPRAGSSSARAGAQVGCLLLVLAANSVTVPNLNHQVTPELNPLFGACAQSSSALFTSLGSNWEAARLGEQAYLAHSFMAMVGRHLAGSLPPRGKLACEGAGQISYFWARSFQDTGALVMPLPGSPYFRSSDLEPPMWYLLYDDELCRSWKSFAGRGYRFYRIYWHNFLEPGHRQEYYELLVHSVTEGIPLVKELFRPATGEVAWWLVPSEYAIVFGDRERPLVDAPRDYYDWQHYPELASYLQPWLMKETGRGPSPGVR